MSQPIALLCYSLDDAQRAAIDAAFGARIRTAYVDRIEDIDEAMLPDVVALLGWIPTDLPARCPNLRWVQTASAGVESHVAALRGRDVTLTNASGIYGAAIAEHLLMMMLMLLRRMPAYGRQQARGEWHKLGGMRGALGLTVTIVGFGDIGSTFGRYAAGMGAIVRGVKRTATSVKPDWLDALYAVDRLDEALDGTDVVALCLPQTEGTRGLLTRERIQALPRDAIVLNIGRGGAIDQEALVEALLAERVYAGLDVMTPEPLPADHPLWRSDRVVLTPHVSGGTSIARIGVLGAALFARNAARFVRGDALENVVDREAGY